MILFWSLGGVLAAGALFHVLHPLLSARGGATLSRNLANVAIYRDQLRELEADIAAGTLAQADYERARAELEARLLQDVARPVARKQSAHRGAPGAALAAGIAIPLIAVVVYLLTGNPGAIDRTPPKSSAPVQMVERLAARLRANPEDAAAWQLLGRSYSALGRFPEAAKAYAQAAQRTPQAAPLLADFAEALAMARGRRLEGEPEKLILRALEIDTDNLKALALAGTVAYERKDYARATVYWRRLLALVPPGSENARIIRANVDKARELAGRNAPPKYPGP